MYYIIVVDIIVGVHPDKGKAEEKYELFKKQVKKGTPMCLAKAVFNGVGIMEAVVSEAATPEPKKEIILDAGIQTKPNDNIPHVSEQEFKSGE